MVDSKQAPGGFVAGLVLGLGLGSSLSYLSGSDGRQQFKQLAAKWEEAKQDLYKQGLIDDLDLSLADFRDQFALKLKQSLLNIKDDVELWQLAAKQEKTKQAKRRRSRRRQKKTRFKGV